MQLSIFIFGTVRAAQSLKVPFSCPKSGGPSLSAEWEWKPKLHKLPPHGGQWASSFFLIGILFVDPLFFFHHVPHVYLCILHFQNSCALFWNDNGIWDSYKRWFAWTQTSQRVERHSQCWAGTLKKLLHLAQISVTDLKRLQTLHSLCCDFGGFKTIQWLQLVG